MPDIDGTPTTQETPGGAGAAGEETGQGLDLDAVIMSVIQGQIINSSAERSKAIVESRPFEAEPTDIIQN